jgi:hypothetical protein
LIELLRDPAVARASSQPFERRDREIEVRGLIGHLRQRTIA